MIAGTGHFAKLGNKKMKILKQVLKILKITWTNYAREKKIETVSNVTRVNESKMDKRSGTFITDTAIEP